MKSKRLLSVLLTAIMLISVLSGCGGNGGKAPAQEAPVEEAPAEQAAAPEASAESADTRIIVDSEGREVEIPAKIERAVCASVGSLRYTCYLGAQDRIVGVEEYEQKPSIKRLYNYVNREQFSKLPAIGVMDDPDPEAIMSVDAQVIIMGDYIHTADEIQEKTGIPVVYVPFNSDGLTADSYTALRILGNVYGLEEKAEELCGYLKSVEEDFAKRTADIKEEDKPTVYVGGLSFLGAHGFNGTQPYYDPFVLVNAHNPMDDTGFQDALEIDMEQILKWDPDIIFVDYNGLDLINEQYANNPDFFNSLTAVKEGRVYSQISFRAAAGNLEMAIADAYYAGKVIYPDRFEDVDIEAKSREIFTTLLGADPYDDLVENGYEFRQIVLGE